MSDSELAAYWAEQARLDEEVLEFLCRLDEGDAARDDYDPMDSDDRFCGGCGDPYCGWCSG